MNLFFTTSSHHHHHHHHHHNHHHHHHHLFQGLEPYVLGAVVCVEDGDVGGGPAVCYDRLLLEVLEEQAEREVASKRLDVHLG